MDTRVGYPNEHMAGDSDSEVTSPMYATAVGLVLNGLENTKVDETKDLSGETEPQDPLSIAEPEGEEIEKEKKKGFFDKWVENLKDFLDNAE
jgi:cell division protein FtsA